MDDFLSDQDEWDVLNDDTIKKTIKDQHTGDLLMRRFEVGDQVEAIGGQYRGIKG